MASEEDLAVYVEQVLPRLVEVGATGALLWCYADYADELAGRPPCDESRHERWFGLVRLDGSWKPHAQTVQRFVISRPVVQPARRTVALDFTQEEYYRDPLTHARRLYRHFVSGSPLNGGNRP